VTLWLPLVARLPLQAPPALQEAAPVDDQLNSTGWPTNAVEVEAERLTVGATGGLGDDDPPPPQALRSVLLRRATYVVLIDRVTGPPLCIAAVCERWRLFRALSSPV
jgi:hypothetical protein